jgi:hypothetical protein
MDPRKCNDAKAGRETNHLYKVLTGLKLTTNAVLCNCPSSP